MEMSNSTLTIGHLQLDLIELLWPILENIFLLFYLNDFQVANSGVHVGVIAHVGHMIVSGKADNEQAKCMLVIT